VQTSLHIKGKSKKSYFLYRNIKFSAFMEEVTQSPLNFQ
jgi:hypothetical protein